MIIGNSESNPSEDVILRTPAKKRSKEQGQEKKSKKQKSTKEVNDVGENIDITNIITEENPPENLDSPIFIPTLSSPEPMSPETVEDTPTHEENGIVERANQEVIRHLTAILADEDVRKIFPAIFLLYNE